MPEIKPQIYTMNGTKVIMTFQQNDFLLLPK